MKELENNILDDMDSWNWSDFDKCWDLDFLNILSIQLYGTGRIVCYLELKIEELNLILGYERAGDYEHLAYYLTNKAPDCIANSVRKCLDNYFPETSDKRLGDKRAIKKHYLKQEELWAVLWR